MINREDLKPGAIIKLNPEVEPDEVEYVVGEAGGDIFMIITAADDYNNDAKVYFQALCLCCDGLKRTIGFYKDDVIVCHVS